MKPIVPPRYAVELQGFTGLPDAALSQLQYWLRLAPAVCAAWVGTATFARSPVMLALVVPFALAGAIGPAHPFDVIYNRMLRRRFAGPAIPSYPAPRRFACGLAAALITFAAVTMAAGWTVTALAAGGLVTSAALINVTTGFCVPSFIYRTAQRAGSAFTRTMSSGQHRVLPTSTGRR